jgi:hypothetical protein
MRLMRFLGLAAALATCSFAAEQISWFSNGFTAYNQPNLHTGTISYATQGGKLIGSGIDIDVLQGLAMPLNSNLMVNCFSCVVNFKTGNNTADTSGNSWSFSNVGSTISITGGFDLNHNGVLDATDIQPGTTLLTGTFASSIAVTDPNLLKPDLLFTASTVLNVVNTQLSNFYGVAGGYTWNGDYSQTFDTTRPQFTGAPGHYKINTVAMRNGVLNDRLVVPEPTDVLLFSSVTGILFAAVLLRRRRLAQQA